MVEAGDGNETTGGRTPGASGGGKPPGQGPSAVGPDGKKRQVMDVEKLFIQEAYKARSLDRCWVFSYEIDNKRAAWPSLTGNMKDPILDGRSVIAVITKGDTF